MVSNYYNENDSFAAAWLRELIKRNLIAPGEVDERDIREVRADDLRGFTQCHFFAGIGVWSYALRQAGWPDDERVWTGSCPCQPFSVSGKRAGASDERHLWPIWFPLIRESRPELVFGEQVASDDGLAWLDLVSADLEGQDYTLGAVDTPACGFGAPHRRQRLYWVADARCTGERRRPAIERPAIEDSPERCEEMFLDQRCGSAVNLADATSRNSSDGGLQRSGQHGQFAQDSRPLRLADSEHDGQATNGFWRDAEWLWCRDQKYRPVEAGTFPLAHGIAKRVGKLRGFGNALVAPQAQAFIEAVLACHEQTDGG